MNLADFKVGQRVQMHPSTHLHMRGARYGTVTKIGVRLVHVKLDWLPSVGSVRVHPENLLIVE